MTASATIQRSDQGFTYSQLRGLPIFLGVYHMKNPLFLRALLLATLLGGASQAGAALIAFSFSGDGSSPVSGTVSGTIELGGTDGVFPATSVIVTSAPAALGYTYPFDVLANFTTQVPLNSFTINGGIVDVNASQFFAFYADGPDGSSFALNASGGFFNGSGMNIQLSTSPSTGVVDADSSTLVYAPVDVPAPATLVLMAVGLLAMRAPRRTR